MYVHVYVCVFLSRFVWTRRHIFMDGFKKKKMAPLFSWMIRSAICKYHSLRSKVKVLWAWQVISGQPSSFHLIVSKACFVCVVKTMAYVLTPYQTAPMFNHLERDGFWKHWGKRWKCRYTAFSPFPTVFSTPPITNFSFEAAFILSCASALNFDLSNFCHLVKRFTLVI